MDNINKLPCHQLLLYLLTFSLAISTARSSMTSSTYNITLKTPGILASETTTRHKSVHVKWTLPHTNDTHRWFLVALEPMIQRHQKVIEQLTVHRCDASMDRSLWYDDRTICDGARSMFIYQWTPDSSLFPLRTSEVSAFEIDRSQSIVLTVTYQKEKRVHKEQSGVALYITLRQPRFQMGTVSIGNDQQGTRFSCRLSGFPRLLFGAKKLSANEPNTRWRIHLVHVRQFNRKLVQLVIDSKTLTNANRSDVEVFGPDLYLRANDYLLIECEGVSPGQCLFLLYFTYKSDVITPQHYPMCENDDFSHLFKLIPSKQSPNQTTSNIDSSTVFWLICLLLFVTWIFTICGCIIMRRIRGLVNMRPEPIFPMTSQKNRYTSAAGRPIAEQYQRSGDADQIMQIDGENAGAMS